jgi:tetratricopeptide (TPR) repeat protein
VLRTDEGHSALDLTEALEEDPAQLLSGTPSGLGPLDLAAAQDETLAVDASPSGKGLGGDLSLEEEDQTEALDLDGPRTAARGAASDLNLVSEALEPGASSTFLEEQEGEPLAGEFTPAEGEGEASSSTEGRQAGETLAEEAEAVPEEFLGGPDIVEQVESGVDLIGTRSRGETVREDAEVEELPLEEEPLAEEDSAVDLGATERLYPPEEEPAAPASSDIDLGMTEPVEEGPPAGQEPGLDDLESEAAAALVGTREMPPHDQPAQKESAAVDEELDLGESSSEEEPAADEEAPAEEEPAAEEEPEEEETPAAKPRRGGALVLAGTLVAGLVLGAGGLYGALLFNLVPAPGQDVAHKQPPRTQGGPAQGPGGGTTAPAADTFERAQTALQGGDFTQALPILAKLPEDNKTLAARGEARWLGRLQEMVKQERDPAKLAAQLKNDAEVKTAIDELTRAGTADAAFALAQIEELSGAPLAQVKAKYQEGMAKIQGDDKNLKSQFESALQRLELFEAIKPPMGGAGGMGRLERGGEELRFWLALAAVSMQGGGGGQNPKNPPPAGGGGGANAQNPPQPGGGGGANPADDDAGPEAGPAFFRALKEARGGKYDDAIKSLQESRKLHNSRRLLRLRKAQNPNSDPTETIFLFACDEIEKRWQLENAYRAAKVLRDAGYAGLADDLAKQPDTGKALDALMTALKGVADKLNLKDDAKKAIKVADVVNSIGATDMALAVERGKVDAVVTELKNAGVEKFKDLAAPGDFKGTKDDLAAGVKALGDGRLAERAKVEAVAGELKAAGVDKFKDLKDPTEFKGTKDDLAAGVKELGVEKQKVQAVVAKLIAAGAKKFKDVKDPAEYKGNKEELAGGVGEVVEDRDQARTELAGANALLDGALQPMVEGNYLPKDATRKDVPKGVLALRVTADHPVVHGLAKVSSDLGAMGGKAGGELLQGIDVRAQLAAVATDNAQLRGNLAQRWTPQQLLPVWLKVMQTGPGEGATAMALTDVKRVMADKPLPDALCVQALADRNAHKFAEARAGLEELVKAPAADPKPEWRKVTEATLSELKDPAVRYLPEIRKLRAEGRLDGAVAVADEALEVFPAEGFGKANANLRAVRGQVRLDVVRGGSKGRLKPDQLKDVQADAEAAVAGGEAVEGNYLLGRIAEETGALARAQGAYEAALKEHGAAAGGQGFAKDHPGCDVSGHRYRAALARVLLAQAGGAGRAGGAGGFREDRPNEGGAGGQNPPNKEGGAGGQKPPAPPGGGGGENPPKREGVPPPAPAGGVGSAMTYQAPPLLVWTCCGCGCSSVLAVPVLMVDPAAVVDVEGMGQARDERVERAIELARESIKRAEAGECDDAFEGYLILGEALGRKHKWTDGLMAYVEGLRHRCSKYSVGLTFLVSNHPAFKRLDSIEPPDPLQAEAYFAKGLRYYFDRRYEEAEQALLRAVYYSDQDARYQYFLGLARLAQQGKRDMALEDFRQAARLEKQDRPNRYAVSAALERVQGPARRILNEIRDRER